MDGALYKGERKPTVISQQTFRGGQEMKRIIDGRTYNTETATLVCERKRKCITSSSSIGNLRINAEGYLTDLNMCREGIYVTKDGRWFRAGERGPYARQVDDSYIGWDGIFPMEEEEVMHYLESRDQVEELEAHFAHRIEEA